LAELKEIANIEFPLIIYKWYNRY